MKRKSLRLKSDSQVIESRESADKMRFPSEALLKPRSTMACDEFRRLTSFGEEEAGSAGEQPAEQYPEGPAPYGSRGGRCCNAPQLSTIPPPQRDETSPAGGEDPMAHNTPAGSEAKRRNRGRRTPKASGGSAELPRSHVAGVSNSLQHSSL